jgi:N-acetylglucosaminyldiphosphoundecaprenol N-acetyl-beta-D-mannosaminyltransferase
MTSSPPPAVRLLGVPVHLVTPEETMRRLEEFVEDGRPHHVVTVNPEFIMAAQKNAEFYRVLNAAHLALPDGIGVVWACRLMGYPLTERVTGVDTVQAVARLAARRRWRLFLLGAAPGIAEQAAAVLQRANPGLQIAGTYAGSPAPAEEDHIVEMVRAAAPHFLFVAYGAPQQDLWIARNLARLGVPVAMGVGGTFDFLAGKARRAPAWMQRAGLEWLYRLMQEPRRWRRMLALPRFALCVLWEHGLRRRRR